MNKQDFMKLQSCVLRVNIDCDGCKHKVKKLLQKIDGVYTTAIDAELGKVVVTGNVDPAILIRKLDKSGKHAELWGPQKGSNNINFQNLVSSNQFKNMGFEKAAGNKDNKSQKGGNNNQPKSGGGQQQQQQLQQQQLQQMMQQFKGSKDFKMPHKDQKSVKFDLPEDDLDDEEFDDGEDGDFDDEFDEDDFGHGHHHLPKPNKNNGPQGMIMNGPDMVFKKGGGGGAGGGGGKKGGGAVDIAAVMMMGEKDSKKGSKGDNKGGKQDKGGKDKNSGWFFGFGKKKGSESKNRDKSGGLLGFGKKNKDEDEDFDFTNKKNGKSGGKNGKNGSGGGGGDNNGNGPKKGGPKSDGAHEIGKMKNGFEGDFGNYGKAGEGNGKGHGNGGGGKNMGQMGFMGQMGNYPMGPMANHPTGSSGSVQGLPALGAMNGGHYPGMGPGNPYGNQQHMAMMMNQHMNAIDMYQPMMYASPHQAVNYGPPPMVPLHATDNYTHFFSDENANSCSIM